MDTIIFSKTAKLAGTSTISSWSQVFFEEAVEENIKQARGQLYAVLEIAAGGDFSAANAGRETWEKLATSYFESDSGGPLEALEKAVSEAGLKTEDEIRSFAGTIDRENWQFAILGAVLWGKVLYLALLGGAKVQLIRNKTIQTIVTNQPKKFSEQTKIQLASGYIEDNDILILESEGFARAINAVDLQSAIDSNEVSEIVESLAPKVHSLADSSTTAALFIKLSTVETPNLEDEGVVFVENRQGEAEIVGQKENNLVDGNIQVEAVGGKLRAIIDSLKSKFLKRTSVLYLREKRFDRTKRQKLILVIIASLVVFLIVSVFWGLSQRSQDNKKVKFSSLYEEAQQFYDQGQGLIDLNPAKARENFQKSAAVLIEAKLVGVEKGKVNDLEAKINDGLSKSLQLVTIDSPTTFLDLGLVKVGAVGVKIAGFDKTLVVFDGANRSILKVDADSKSAEVSAGGPELANGNLIAAGNDFAYVYVAGDGIWRVNLRDKSKKKVIDKDSAWGEIVDIYSFAGNVYLVDKSNSQVHKYSATKDGYGSRTGFINDDVSRDLSSATSVTIDGLIWVLSTNGKIDKLIGGRVESFEISGLDKPITSPIGIDGDDRAKYLYILDKVQKRVVVATKDGQYWSQYVSEVFANASDLYVDEPAKKLFVLAGNKIIVVELK